MSSVDGDGVVVMAAEMQTCVLCGAPLTVQRRLVPSVGGSWVVMASAPACANPHCPQSAEGRARAGGMRAAVA